MMSQPSTPVSGTRNRAETLRYLNHRIRSSRYCSSPATAYLFLGQVVGKKIWGSSDLETLTDDQLAACVSFMEETYPDRRERIYGRVEQAMRSRC